MTFGTIFRQTETFNIIWGMLRHTESDSLWRSIPGIWDKLFQSGENHVRRSKNEGEISENAGDPPQKKIVKRSYLLLNLELGALLWAVGSPYIYLQTILATFGPNTIFQHNIFSRGQTHSTNKIIICL